MRETPFKVGDIVKLKSGGPEMTVQLVDPTLKSIRCSWFAGKKLEHGSFVPEAILKVTAKGSTGDDEG
jgi:uncharacterized protein YodC (DUF2158 family)